MKNKEIKQSTIDALALEIFEEFKNEKDCVTLAEAQEMAKMELNARNIKRYEKSETPRKTVEREKKIDLEKKEIFLLIQGVLSENVKNIATKNESEIAFDFKENSYTVKIIKHRPPK